jgi:hypothetical protein
MRVQRLRGYVGLIGPDDRAGLRVGTKPPEVLGIRQRFENTVCSTGIRLALSSSNGVFVVAGRLL